MDAELAAYWNAGMEETVAMAHRLGAACIGLQTQDGRLLGRLNALSRELAQLDPSSPAAALVAKDGSGFEAMAAIVEQVEGERFRELFSGLPTTRAATGPQALQQVLALARGQTAAPSMQDFLQAIVAPLAAAAAAGQDLEPLLAEFRQRLAESDPNIDAAQLDALMEALREAAKGERPA